MSTAAWAAVAGVFGAVIGSFLNVVAYRLPRGESLVSPGSRCPACGTPIKPYDNIPVLGWLLLRGRCRNCGERISPRYPLVEVATGLLCAAVVLRYGADDDVWLPLAFVILLVPVTLIDLDHRIIPNKLMIVGAVVAVALVLATASEEVTEYAIAGAAAFGFFFLAALAYPAGMGMGDVKLAGVMGLFLGREVAPALFVGLIAGTVVGVAIIARRGAAEGRKTAVPFGPFLALGSVVAVFVGDEMVDWYVDTFFEG